MYVGMHHMKPLGLKFGLGMIIAKLKISSLDCRNYITEATKGCQKRLKLKSIVYGSKKEDL